MDRIVEMNMGGMMMNHSMNIFAEDKASRHQDCELVKNGNNQ
jgi:hypothetical protein